MPLGQENLIATNRECEEVATTARTRINAETSLHLFVNDYTPDPTSEESDFVEADYNTYAEIDLAGEWGAVVKEDEGIYRTQTDTQEFAVPTSGGPQTVYGAYIMDGTEVIFAARLPVPVDMEVGGDTLRVRVVYRIFAAALLVV